MIVADRFIVIPVLRVIEDGIVKSERQYDPVTVFGVDGLRELADEMPAIIERTEVGA